MNSWYAIRDTFTQHQWATTLKGIFINPTYGNSMCVLFGLQIKSGPFWDFFFKPFNWNCKQELDVYVLWRKKVIAHAKVTAMMLGCCRWFPGCCYVFWWLLECYNVISGVLWVIAYQPKSRALWYFGILIWLFHLFYHLPAGLDINTSQVNFRIGV